MILKINVSTRHAKHEHVRCGYGYGFYFFLILTRYKGKKTLNVAKDFLVRCGQRVRRFYNENFRSKK